MGNVTSRTIKASGGSITFQHAQIFDELGRLLTQIGANSQTTSYAYEKNNNLKSVTDPRSGVYSYAYDGLNRLIQASKRTRDLNWPILAPLNLNKTQTFLAPAGFSELAKADGQAGGGPGAPALLDRLCVFHRS